jgi:3-oxoacyl-[acyl-carrier-protein] synthase III
VPGSRIMALGHHQPERTLTNDELAVRREIPPGAPTLLLGFGGGLSWAAQVVSCP